MKFYTCFACGKPIINTNVPCPHCGDIGAGSINLTCPNLIGAICSLTDNLCSVRGDYGRCPTKNKFDREDDL